MNRQPGFFQDEPAHLSISIVGDLYSGVEWPKLAEGVWKLLFDGCKRVRQPDQSILADRARASVTYQAQKSPSGP